MSLKLGNTTISGVATPIDGSIAIGQIISSIIPLTDAGLHLLDGSIIQGGGIYDAFVQYIANLVNLYPQCFTDETTWQNTVNSKGVCGKFVYNSINNTVRLPKITGFIEGTVDSSALGDLVEAGLPNITGQFGRFPYNVGADQSYTSSSGVLYYTRDSGINEIINNNSTNTSGSGYINFDASRSSSIYGNSNTVQPQSIKVFYYIVVATTTKTDIEVDIDEIATDLNSKANNADVVHLAGAETITGTKTFAGDGWITKIQNTDVTYNIAPSSNKSTSIIFTDKNGTQMGCFESMRYPSNNTLVRFNVYGANGNWASQPLELVVDANGNLNAYAPTPSVSSNETNIATTAYVNNKFQVVSTLPANPDGNVYYFIPE